MKVLKFRPAKKKSRKKDKNPPLNYSDGATAVQYCFELVSSALSQENKDEVAKNLLTWFIVNVDQETLTRFIKWIVEDDNEDSEDNKSEDNKSEDNKKDK